MKSRLRLYFKDFGYKVIRLKYFIMIVVALFLEIVTLTLYLLKMQDIVAFELFNLAILYGAISGIIVVLAIGILVLMKLDRVRDTDKVKKFQEFQMHYRSLSEKFLNDINRLMGYFENERSDIDSKLEYAIALEDKFDNYHKEFSQVDVPDFLSYAHRSECDHLEKEKDFYRGFSSLTSPDVLKDISNESEMKHDAFLKEIHGVEKSLRLII